LEASTPIHIDVLETELAAHPDRQFVNKPIDGLRNGFHPGVQKNPADSFECNNLLLAHQDMGYV
jgi:hypothetical protein